MKNQITITIDLTKSTEEIFEQIEEAKKKLNKKPWWKRIFCWF